MRIDIKPLHDCRGSVGVADKPAVIANPSEPRQVWSGLALVAMLLASTACRQDMHDQPKYQPLEQSSFFEDGRASRPLVAGTIAQGHLNEDEQLYTG